MTLFRRKDKDSEFDTIIESQTNLFHANLGELMKYKDLIWLFVKRNISIQYKQTILGPLWFLVHPLITTFMYSVIFGGIAGISTDNAPNFLFYLIGNAAWSYFATCATQTANTFIGNAGIMGKVYFPRLALPISTVIYASMNFLVTMMLAAIMLGYNMFTKGNIVPNNYIVIIPILIIQIALLGLGVGIITSALTTKYHDLQILISFGISLWMYATPIVYPMSIVPEHLKKYLLLNPLSPIVNNFRYALLGTGELEWDYWYISIIVTMVILFLGIALFNKVEKTFMDTV